MAYVLYVLQLNELIAEQLIIYTRVNKQHVVWIMFSHTWANKGHLTHEPRTVTMNEIVRAQMKVSKGRPKTLPKSRSVVTDPQVYCEAICDRALDQMLFQSISIHAGPHTW